MNQKEAELAKKMGEFMRTERRRSGFTQTYLADYLGISQAAISKIEKGTTQISAIAWLRFCQLVNLPPDTVLKD